MSAPGRGQTGGEWGSCVNRREPEVADQFDVTLEDSDLLREVELTTNLMVAASESDDELTLDQIDRILGVTH